MFSFMYCIYMHSKTQNRRNTKTKRERERILKEQITRPKEKKSSFLINNLFSIRWQKVSSVLIPFLFGVGARTHTHNKNDFIPNTNRSEKMKTKANAASSKQAQHQPQLCKYVNVL